MSTTHSELDIWSHKVELFDNNGISLGFGENMIHGTGIMDRTPASYNFGEKPFLNGSHNRAADSEDPSHVRSSLEALFNLVFENH